MKHCKNCLGIMDQCAPTDKRGWCFECVQFDSMTPDFTGIRKFFNLENRQKTVFADLFVRRLTDDDYMFLASCNIKV